MTTLEEAKLKLEEEIQNELDQGRVPSLLVMDAYQALVDNGN